MEKQNKIIKTAFAAIVTTGLTVATTQAMAAEQMKMEKCYGVAKKGMNDCGGKGAGHSCQGQSKINGDKNDWLFVPKGTCDKLVGGSTTPTDESTDKSTDESTAVSTDESDDADK